MCGIGLSMTFFSVLCLVCQVDSTIVRAILQGPGVNNLGHKPGMYDFYHQDLPYYHEMKYQVFNPSSNRADLLFLNEQGNTDKRIFVGGLSRENLVNLVEDQGLIRHGDKKLTGEQLLKQEMHRIQASLHDLSPRDKEL